MGSPVVLDLFFLSFTSYNPDISSDYRQIYFYFWGNASLLGYNQIIVYSSHFSAFYYPAPGPSFFNTDIRNFITPTNPSCFTDITTSHGNDCYFPTVKILLLQPIYELFISIVAPPCLRLSLNINPAKTYKIARSSTTESRWESTHQLRHKAKTTNNSTFVTTKIENKVIPPWVGYAVIMSNDLYVSQRAKIESRLHMQGREGMKLRKSEIQTCANKNTTNTEHPLITLIMVISTRDHYIVKTYFKYLSPNPNHRRHSWQSSPYKSREVVNAHPKEAKSHSATLSTNTHEARTTTLMRVIMVISTRDDIAVKLSANSMPQYNGVLELRQRSRLVRSQEETQTKPNETSEQNRTNNKEVPRKQINSIITVITLIVVISTRDDIAVKLYMNYETILAIKLNVSHRFGLPRQRDEVGYIYNESARQNLIATMVTYTL